MSRTAVAWRRRTLHLARNAPVPAVWHNWGERSVMVHYMFETEWVLTAPIGRVFELLAHPEDHASCPVPQS